MDIANSNKQAVMSFFDELKRRNVFRVGIAYVIVAWLLLQVADVVLNNIEAPAWVFQAILLLLVIGLPMTSIFAWAFELTPEGIKKERDVDRSESVTRITGRKLDFAIIGMLILALGGVVWTNYLRNPEPSSAQINGTTAVETEARVDTSIAVLPFVNMSADPDQEFFSDGITEEILNTLVAIDELQVTGRTSSFTFKGRNDVDLKTIGQMLGVIYILEGSVRKAGKMVRITAQLTTAENGFHLWSNTYDRELTEIFEIQEEIASAIGEALQVELGLKVAQFLDRRRTDNPEAYEWNLRGDQLLRNTDVTSQKLAAEAFQKAIRLDQNYVPAYVGYAMTQTSLLAMGGGSVTELQQEAEQALDVVARLDPEYSRRYVALGSLYQFRNDFVAAESAFKRALELNPEDLLAQSAWANYLVNWADRPEEAIELYQQYLKREPMDAANFAMAIASAGRIDEAEVKLRRVIEIDPDYFGGYDSLSDLYAYYMNRLAESLPLRRKAFEFNPEGVLLMNQTARTYLDLGDDAAAERWVQEAERISERAYWTISAKYFLSHYRGDEKLSQSLSRQLAHLAEVNRYGWWSTADVAWLRTLQGEDPDTALGVYKTLTPEVVVDEPTVDSWSHAIAISLAALYLQTGNEALANDLLDQSLAVIESADVHYNHPHKTAIYALKGDTRRALEELRISIDANWRWEWWMLEKDPIYQLLWDEPEFDAMMDEIRDDMAAQLERVEEMRRNGELQINPKAVLAE